uniref:APCDD1 domain-containing protein n=1 Tax=Timema shepardi TaxID=629360 RepID=A0A7R9ANR9_TIMSH|nr:unnamed protein product [Timema shepardi]
MRAELKCGNVTDHKKSTRTACHPPPPSSQLAPLGPRCEQVEPTPCELFKLWQQGKQSQSPLARVDCGGHLFAQSPVNTDLLECACAVTTCIHVHSQRVKGLSINSQYVLQSVCLSVCPYADSKWYEFLGADLTVPDSIPGTSRFLCESLRLDQAQLGFWYIKLRLTVSSRRHPEIRRLYSPRAIEATNLLTGSSEAALSGVSRHKEPGGLNPFWVLPPIPSVFAGRCEVRPGPEFVLRSYTFMKNNSFKLLQFHYEDEWCSLPLYTITARGRVWLRENSWVTRGATEAEYTLERATVTAHSAGVAVELARRVNKTCPGQVRRRWKPYREYVVYSLPGEDEGDNTISNQHPPVVIPHPRRENTLTGRLRLMHTEDVDCLSALHAVFHELQLVRVHRRPPGPPDSRYPRHELLLGDLHSRPELRSQYRPTAFQTPLLRADQRLLLRADQVRETATQSRLAERLLLRAYRVRETSVQRRLGERLLLRAYRVRETATQSRPEQTRRERLLLRADQARETAAQSRSGERDYCSEQTRRERLLLRADQVRETTAQSRSGERDCCSEQTRRERLLFRSDRSQWCPVCQAVSRASERAPPDLHARPRLPVLHSYLAGEWVSTRCETRPLGLFLKRRLRFSAVDRTWRGEYRFFGDLACTAPLFTATAGGRYSGRGSELDFRMEQASLTVLDSAMAKSLRCGAEPWVSGVPRDLSRSHGCSDLGILIPSVEYEAVRVDVDTLGSSLLLLGQPDTDNRRRGPEDRPTAYQPPLVQCRPQDADQDNTLYPVHYAQVGPRPYASGTAPSSCVALLLTLGIALVGTAQWLLNL